MDTLKNIVQLTQEQYDDMMADPDKQIKDSTGAVIHTYDKNIFYCIPEEVELTGSDELKPIPDSVINALIPTTTP